MVLLQSTTAYDYFSKLLHSCTYGYVYYNTAKHFLCESGIYVQMNMERCLVQSERVRIM